MSSTGISFESLDFKIATGLWKILKGDFEKKFLNEERTYQRADPHYMLTGRQIAFRIFEHFQLPETRRKILDVNHLFALKMQRDDLRLYDLQWDEILLKIVPPPPEEILETIYSKQLEQSIQFKDTMNLYKLNASQGMIIPSYRQLKRMVKYFLEDQRTQRHDAGLLAIRPGMAAPALKDSKDKKTNDCRQWIKLGKCARGNDCHYKHVPAMKGPTKTPGPSAKSKGKDKKRKESRKTPKADTK